MVSVALNISICRQSQAIEALRTIADVFLTSLPALASLAILVLIISLILLLSEAKESGQLLSDSCIRIDIPLHQASSFQDAG